MRAGAFAVCALALIGLAMLPFTSNSLFEHISNAEVSPDELKYGPNELLDPHLSGRIIQNEGQVADSEILYYAQLHGAYVGFAVSKVYLSPTCFFQDDTVILRHKGPDPINPIGLNELSGRLNYFIAQSRFLDVRSYGEIMYHNNLTNESLTFYIEYSLLKYRVDSYSQNLEFRSLMNFPEDSRISIDADTISFLAPVYHRPQFALSDYDTYLEFSTFLGSEGDDYSHGMAIDDEDNIYVVGQTGGSLFPTHNAFQDTKSVGSDWFVSKFTPNGQELIYSTFIGGTGGSGAYDIEIDSNRNAIIAGLAFGDFPVSNKTDSSFGTANGALALVKLNATGNGLVFTTRIGSDYPGYVFDIELDDDDNIYAAGYTQAVDFPMVNAFSGYQGGYDCFLLKLNSTGSDLLYSTYLGGSECEWIYALELGKNGCVYVGGASESTDLPFCNAIDTTPGGVDCFVFKLNISNNELHYCTLVGGSHSELLNDIAVDEEGNLYATGYCNGDDFPIHNAIQEERVSALEAFVFKLNATGTGFVYSTYIGGEHHDEGKCIELDAQGNVYIAGTTGYNTYPVVNADPVNNYGFNVFLTKINPEGSFITCSTSIGQVPQYQFLAMEVDSSQNMCLTGEATSSFPTINALFVENLGLDEMFVLKFNMNDSLLAPVTTHPDDILRLNGSEDIELEWRAYDTDFQSYEILKNGVTLVSEITSNSSVKASIFIEANEIFLDEYSFHALDSQGHLTVDSVQVRVIDNSTPSLDHPGDITFDYRIGTHLVEWVPIDDNPQAYNVYKNGSLLMDGEWTGASIVVDVSNFEEGAHNLTLCVFDLSSNQANDTVWIYVNRDSMAPVILSDVSSHVFTIGTETQWINWSISDVSPMNYTIRLNGTVIQTGNSEAPEASILLLLNDYSPSEYNFSISVSDRNGNSAYDMVWISIHEPLTTTITQTDTTTNATLPIEIVQIVSYTITIGSLVVIAVVIILIIRSRKSTYSYQM